MLEHWLPYTERDLERVLDTNRSELRVWLHKRPLADLARVRHLSTRQVLRRVMRPVRREYPQRYGVLYARARRTLTQRHLMQHMLFHPLHNTILSQYTVRALGIGWLTINQLRRQGKTFNEVAKVRGLAPWAFERGGVASIRESVRRGMRQGLIPRRQGWDYLHEVDAVLPQVWSGTNN